MERCVYDAGGVELRNLTNLRPECLTARPTNSGVGRFTPGLSAKFWPYDVRQSYEPGPSDSHVLAPKHDNFGRVVNRRDGDLIPFSELEATVGIFRLPSSRQYSRDNLKRTQHYRPVGYWARPLSGFSNREDSYTSGFCMLEGLGVMGPTLTRL
ncbi:unnamed protein product [Protopolystoma xenopodis]|uniref:Uncharacterized protein n=1 Tax=Protopolystoma xenopodis TaxID=117903 RepID=A0A3S5FDB6_9PLAT|nr:unnamed protein product [Protopolystoma xenopodis]